MTRSAYKKCLLAVLVVVLAFNNADSLALGLVLQSIKADLQLTDTQLGFLSGVAFSLFYSVMGIPIARWADRGNRVTIISATTAAWGVMLAACGFAANFTQLLLIRVGVAVGEAGCIPPAHSLIADYFARSERPRAVGVYMLGGSLSLFVGYFAAGWLNEFYGWRGTFMVLGAAGLAPALLVWFILKEPRRAQWALGNRHVPGATKPTSVDHPMLVEVIATLWRNITFRQLLYCFSITYFFGFGIAQWQPAFFIRSFGMSSGQLGTWFTVLCGSGSLIGTYLGGVLASRYAANNERRQLRAMAIGNAVFGLLSACIYLTSSVSVALGIVGLSTIVGTATQGPLFATIQTLVPERMRATSIAIIYFFANLIGMGLGPLAAGGLSDVLHPIVGEESLRYALLVLCPGSFWAATHLWRASRTVSADIRGGAEGALPGVDAISVDQSRRASIV